MLNKEKDIKDVNLLIGTWITAIRLNNAIYYLDINKVSEGFATKLLNLLFDYELEDLNKIAINYPGLDLGNFNTSKVAFQVTSSVTTDKIISSLKTIIKNNDHLKFTGGIKFLILREGEKITFTKRTTDPKNHLPAFEVGNDILYPEHLIKKISDIYDSDDFATFLKIKQLVERELPLVRKERLEEAERSMEQVTRALTKQLSDMAEKVGQREQAFDYDNFLTADFPDLVVRSQRTELRSSYLQELNIKPIFWLCGVSGTGKSSLAWLIGQAMLEKKYWIDFRDVPATEVHVHLVRSLNNSLGITPSPPASNLAEIMITIGRGGLIVLNDFPEIANVARANTIFTAMIGQAIKYGVRVLVTSNFSCSLNFKAQFGEHLSERNIPLFTATETGEVLLSFGAPEFVVKKHAKSVKILSEGYPIIINSIANYLKEKKWEIDETVINNIFKNDYNDQLNHEIYGSVVASTEDEDTLSLLYRCISIIGNFGQAELDAIASVTPAISFVNQKFEKIKGIWVQRTQFQSYQLSPLIRRLQSNFAPQLVLDLNKALGEALVKKKKLNQIEVAKCIQYFINGEAYTDAAMMLTAVLNESLKNPALFFEWGFTLYWFDTEIPKEVNVPTRLFIRFLQINVCIAANEDFEYQLADIKKILDTEEVEPRALGLAHMLFYQLEVKTDPVNAMKHLLVVFKNLPLKELLDSNKETDSNLTCEVSIWLPFCGCVRDADYTSWFTQVKEIELEKKALDPATNDAYHAAGNSLYVNLVDGRNREELWKAQLLLIKILDMALEAEFYLVAAYALKNIVFILCAEFNLYDSVETQVLAYSRLLEADSICKFLILDELGRQMFVAGHKEKSAAYLDQIIDTELPQTYVEIATTYRIYSQIKGGDYPKIGNDYLEKALNYAESYDSFQPLEKVKLYGETGISYWLSGKLEDAVAKLEQGYDLLHKIFDDSPDHQAQVIRYGSVANYIVHQMRTGTTLKEAESGAYAIPQRGWFYFTNDKLLKSGMYHMERRYMSAHVFQVAYEFLGNYDLARKWALNCIQVMLEVEDPRFAILLHGSLFYLINDREYGKALNVANYIKTHYKSHQKKAELSAFDQQIEAISEKIGEDDVVFYAFLFTPMLFKVIPDVMDGTISKQQYDQLTTDLFDLPENSVSDIAAFNFLRQIFGGLLYDRVDYWTLQDTFRNYSSDYEIEFKTVAYLLAGIHSTAEEAAKYQLSIVNRFENLYRKQFSEIVSMLIVPFFEKFWLIKAEQCKNEFYDYQLWENESIPKFMEEKGIKKVKKLFQTLNYHLDLNLPADIVTWIRNK